MKIVYSPSNVAEAHMLVDLLKQQNIEAFIRGEHLQGAIGELPAMGVLQIEVAEHDVEEATRFLNDWDDSNEGSVERDREIKDRNDTKPRKRFPRMALSVFGGLVVGALVTTAWFRVPANADSLDNNGDYKPDAFWTFSPAGLPLKLEQDRNFDGRIDEISTFNARGQYEETKSDDDFNDVFETTVRYENNAFAMTLTDRDGDGFPEVRAFYRFGLINVVEFVSPSTQKAVRVTHFRLSYADYADIDTDNDGVLDTREKYSLLGDIVSKEKL